MGYRLVPKLVTLNDLERCNGHYFALFRPIQLLSWPSPDEFLVTKWNSLVAGVRIIHIN